MNKSVLRKTFIFIILLNLLFSGDLFAQTDTKQTGVKVAIIPFSLDAKQPGHQIKNKIPLMISEKLEQEGAKVIFLETWQNTEEWDFLQFRKLGIESGVDYIMTGSIFVAGESISIDSRLVNIYEKENSISFYADANNFESLFSTISQLSKEIIGELFQKKIITDIEVTGNKRVGTDAIIRIMDTQIGDIVKPDNISKDLKKIYEMGYFDNVIVKQESLDKGVKLIFEITEKSTVRKVKFKKNTVYDDEELADIVDTRTGGILNIHKLNSDIDRMRLMYTVKNYHNCSVTYEIIPLEHSQADIVFSIEEGEKIKVEKIIFEGNKHFSDKKIKKAMETSEKGFFSFFTSSGDLNEIEVKNDVIRIESLYKNNGFIDTKVSDPIIDIGEELISIRFKIDEGAQYKIKKIDITGDLILTKEEILKIIQSKETKLYNREFIRKDILAISDIYSDRGFANVNVAPIVNKNDEEKMMNITYSINKGDPVYFNRVNISGNLKTRDKVIRREIKILEQGLYSKDNIQKSFKNLNRLDYFAEIDVKPVKTSDENKMDLDVRVVEKETGKFSVGGGFSSADGGFIMGSVQERNLFGKGQTLKLEATLAEESILYNIGFFEPYIMDTAVSGGIQLYKEDKEYDYYDKEAFGLTLKLGYRLFDYTTIGIIYNIEDFEITNIQADHTNMTPGSFLTGSIKPYIQYDSRDDFFLPTEGGKHKFSIEYAGEFLGGDIDYTKYLVETGIFFPLFWKFTGALHAEAGYLDDRSSNDIDIDYIRFYLGGMNSVRGFDKFDISGKRDGDVRDRGGEQYVQFNAEVTFPFTEKYKVACVFFYDRGDVYRTGEDIDLGDQFSSFGTGIRWNSPIGPLRLEYAWVIDGKDVKKSGDGQFEFSVGASF
ncbi:MAG: outer membrane protein assembly factor BamA [Desulfobacterales bacterium]|nr:outer membrane protein assembly factor BamA [Desulfobacterales bacterium]